MQMASVLLSSARWQLKCCSLQKIDKELESALATLDKEKEEALKDLDAQVIDSHTSGSRKLPTHSLLPLTLVFDSMLPM